MLKNIILWFAHILNIAQIFLSLILIIVFWVLVTQTYYLDDLYAKISFFVASHFAFILGIFWYYLSIKERSFIEQWDMWFNKKKNK